MAFIIPVKPGVDMVGLDNEFRTRLVHMLTMMPEKHRRHLTIGSAKRSSYQQWVGWIRHKYFFGPVAARPGTSKHEKGLAVDFHPISGHSGDTDNWQFREALSWMYHNGPKYGIKGLEDRFGKHWERDLVHFEKIEP